jgi:hypothetical protein
MRLGLRRWRSVLWLCAGGGWCWFDIDQRTCGSEGALISFSFRAIDASFDRYRLATEQMIELCTSEPEAVLDCLLCLFRQDTSLQSA